MSAPASRSLRKRFAVTAMAMAACGAGAMLLVSAPTGARAQGVDYYSTLSSSQLWYERNSIFAQHGYCFKSQRGIATFGRVCHPPFGRLPGHMRRVVNNIEAWERRRGCR